MLKYNSLILDYLSNCHNHIQMVDQQEQDNIIQANIEGIHLKFLVDNKYH